MFLQKSIITFSSRYFGRKWKMNAGEKVSGRGINRFSTFIQWNVEFEFGFFSVRALNELKVFDRGADEGLIEGLRLGFSRCRCVSAKAIEVRCFDEQEVISVNGSDEKDWGRDAQCGSKYQQKKPSVFEQSDVCHSTQQRMYLQPFRSICQPNFIDNKKYRVFFQKSFIVRSLFAAKESRRNRKERQRKRSTHELPLFIFLWANLKVELMQWNATSWTVHSGALVGGVVLRCTCLNSSQSKNRKQPFRPLQQC